MFKTRLATRTVAREGIAIRVLNRVVELPLRRVLHVQMVTISVEHSVFLTDVVPQHRETNVRLVLIRQIVPAIVHALRVILVTSYKELPVFRTIVRRVVRVRDVRLV